jgi:outer membrane lipoprotein-sorting protein
LRRDAALILALLCLAGAAFPAAPARAGNTVEHPGSETPGSDAALQQIMLGLQSVKQSRARFVERKYLHMLNQPLESSGTLIYAAPDHLEKNTERPKPERLVVDRDSVVIEGGNGGQSRSLSLADNPEIGAIVASVRATLAGDSESLSRFYVVKLQGKLPDWTLLLEPRDPKVLAMVRSIRIGGRNSRIETVETFEAGGDRSVMTVLPDRP